MCANCGWSSVGPHYHADTLENRHGNMLETWRNEPEEYWLMRLMQEVGELASSLANDHDDPPDWELMQIRAICGNWLLKRKLAEKMRPQLPDGMDEDSN